MRDLVRAALAGEFNCGHCGNRDDCVGGEKYTNFCQEWVPRSTPCEKCGGSGILVNVSGDRFQPPTKPCPTCQRAGWVDMDCMTCGGTGEGKDDLDCPTCHGTGKSEGAG